MLVILASFEVMNGLSLY